MNVVEPINKLCNINKWKILLVTTDEIVIENNKIRVGYCKISFSLKDKTYLCQNEGFVPAEINMVTHVLIHKICYLLGWLS